MFHKGHIVSQETCNKISLSKLGKPRSESLKKKLSALYTGRKLSKNTCYNMSVGLKQSYKNGDRVPAFLGKQLSAEHRKKISEANKGRKLSEGAKRRISLSRLGRKCNLTTIAKMSKNSKQLWKDPEYVQKQMKARKVSPNKAEIFLTTKFQEWMPQEYKYNGTPGADGGFVLAGKVPDWINVNGQKKIIELFGEQFHAPEEEFTRPALFKPYGWSTLIIWGKELKDTEKLKQKVLAFNAKGE